jgi:hypothetical protein
MPWPFFAMYLPIAPLPSAVVSTSSSSRVSPAGMKYCLYMLRSNFFFTSASQAQNFGVELLGLIQIFASDTNMVNTNYFKHCKSPPNFYIWRGK